MGSEAYDLAVWGGNLGKCKMSKMLRNAIRSLAHLIPTYSAEFVLQSDYGFGCIAPAHSLMLGIRFSCTLCDVVLL